ncbi:MAG: hypothetical protein AVDCRST_MAG93-9115 [uncultured Chloroflexia bacterium]|uniref:Uncharacterized protein n=1 Tax=uncultured Chloroflexia bacterium TaxID=1672391 RepID=A0A6J4N739_9CHLR|nr:MAG: hypothetical protein AVDCRST_MAG93-9115 [uncultured Chloroflexia bacterium]
MRTHVSFQSDFSQDAGPSEPAGRELAQWIASGLRAAGYTVGTPANLENYAYSFDCGKANVAHTITVALVGDGVLEWLVLAEPKISTARRLLAKVGIKPGQPSASPELGTLVTSIHELLRADPHIRSIRWYTTEEWDNDPEQHWTRSP